MYGKSNLLTVGSTSLPKSLSFSTTLNSNHTRNGTDGSGALFSNNNNDKLKDKRSSSVANVLNSSTEAVDDENSETESTGSDERKQKKTKTKKKKLHVFAKLLSKDSGKPKTA